MDKPVWQVLQELRQQGNKVKSSNHRKRSKDRLIKSVSKRIETTMIASLDNIEKIFGKLWGLGSKNQTQKEKEFEVLWQILRSAILDKGNAQIAFFKKDMDMYEIEFNGYRYELPVRKPEERGNSNE